MVLSDSTGQGSSRSGIAEPNQKHLFWIAKRTLDIVFSVACLPLIAALAIILLIINPILNPGPVFFTQRRMGRGGTTFHIVKFRTMFVAETVERGALDPVESERITGLGRVLRRLRIDELPQVFNILRGEMSLVGPRPDFVDHAEVYVQTVSGYSNRYAIRPGITGHAQVQMGYADGFDLVQRKTGLDLFYIANAGWRMELRILARTVIVVLSGFGAR